MVGQRLEAVPELAGGLGLLERGDEVGERAVVDPAPALGGLDGEADREMGLTDTGWAEEDHVLLVLQEAELVQGVDLLALDGGLEAEVEVGEQLDGREPRRTHRGLESSVVAQRDLSPEQLFDGFPMP